MKLVKACGVFPAGRCFLSYRRIRRTRPNIALMPDPFSRLGRIFDAMRAVKAALPLKRAIDVLHRLIFLPVLPHLFHGDLTPEQIKL